MVVVDHLRPSPADNRDISPPCLSSIRFVTGKEQTRPATNTAAFDVYRQTTAMIVSLKRPSPAPCPFLCFCENPGLKLDRTLKQL